MVDPLYRALVLAALGLAGCESSSVPDASAPETDTSGGSDVAVEDAGEDVAVEDAGQEDAPCPADAERATPPCYFIL